jgi:AraC-like DNA-binding protein
MVGDLVHLARPLRARLDRLGANVAHAMAAARVPDDGAVTTDVFFDFWSALGESAPADIGLRIAKETGAHEYDLSSLAALCSPDLSTALDKIARYKRLCGPKDLVLERKGKDVAIHTTWHHASRPTPARLVDASLASQLVLFQRGTGVALAPKRVELSRARRSHGQSDEPMLMRFFGCPVRYLAGRDALVLDEGALAMPFVTHDADLLAALLPGLDAQLPPRSFVEEVAAVVARRMSGERPSVEKVAKGLAMSTRTLQRRLGEVGVSYQQVLDDVRHRTALRLLRDRGRGEGLEISEIAFLLGFEELNSFSRAFHGWEGTTPKRWRDAMS